MDTIPLRQPPEHVIYPFWPQDGESWIHPDDVAMLRSLIPSQRIFRREPGDDSYRRLIYGDTKLRILPAMGVVVPDDGFEIGDWVEVLSRLGANRARIGQIREMHWDSKARRAQYQVREAGANSLDVLTSDDLRPLESLAAAEMLRQHGAIPAMPATHS